MGGTGGKEDKFLPQNVAKKLTGKDKVEKEERERLRREEEERNRVKKEQAAEKEK